MVYAGGLGSRWGCGFCASSFLLVCGIVLFRVDFRLAYLWLFELLVLGWAVDVGLFLFVIRWFVGGMCLLWSPIWGGYCLIV